MRELQGMTMQEEITVSNEVKLPNLSEAQMIKKGICPSCGGGLIFQEGCKHCPSCDWAACG
jgi:uncharacterized protein (DUF983 family)